MSKHARWGSACVMVAVLVHVGAARAAVVWTPVQSGTTQTITAINWAPSRLTYVTAGGEIFYLDAPYTGAPEQATVTPANPAGFHDVAMVNSVLGIAVGNDGTIYRLGPDSSVGNDLKWHPVSGTMEYPGSCHQPSTGTLGPLTDDLYSVTLAKTPDVAGATAPLTAIYITGANGDILDSPAPTTGAGIDYYATFAEVNKHPTTSNSMTSISCIADPGQYGAFSDAAFSDEGTGYFIGTDESLWETTDGMTTAHQVGASAVNGYSASRLAVDPTDGEDAWLVTPGARNGSYFTESFDGGEDWDSALFDDNQVSLQDVSAANGTAVAAGLGGDIYASSNGQNFIREPVGAPDATAAWTSVAVWDDASAANGPGVYAAVAGQGGALAITTEPNVLADTVAPTGTISGPTRLTVGQAGSYTATAIDNAGGSGVDPSGYVWSSPGRAGQAGAGAHFTFDKPGTYPIALQFRDFAGNGGTATLSVVVTAPAAPSGAGGKNIVTHGVHVAAFSTLTITAGGARYVPITLTSPKGRKVTVTVVTAHGRHADGTASAVFTRHRTDSLHVRLATGAKLGSYLIVVHVYSLSGHSLGPATSITMRLK
jgi:hypothetical protein